VALSRSAARRYAEAAFEIAVRDDALAAWLAAFGVAEERLTGPDVTRLLASPAIPAAVRVEVLTRLLGDDVTGAPSNLMALLVRRGRFELLPTVRREFMRLYRRREGIVEATATSAIALDAADLEALEAGLVAMTGQRVELSTDVDASLLGGVQVRVGDRLIDGSVRGRLQRLHADLSRLAT